MIKQNVSCRMVHALKAMYTMVQSCVRFNSIDSQFIDSNIGVKQGDPCSSILFLLFVNDILQYINTNIDGICDIDGLKLCMLMFCDDAVVFAETPEALQSLLDDMQHYCNQWGMKINSNKTKINIFERVDIQNINLYLIIKRLK